MLHGDNVMTFVPPGAVNIGSTPPTIVIAVTSPESVPSVEIRITASPFWKPPTAAGAIDPIEDPQIDARYRRELVEAMTYRALKQACA